MKTLIHPNFEAWCVLGEILSIAADKIATEVASARKKKRGQSRQPGRDTPLWNALARELKNELTPRGAKAALARYLGIPRQRLQDFIRGQSRLPDAEITLGLIHWLFERRAGRDPSR